MKCQENSDNSSVKRVSTAILLLGSFVGCGPGLRLGVDTSYCATTVQTHPHFHSGSGTAQDPYLICKAEQFAAIGRNSTYWSSHFQLASNIDMSAFDATTTSKSLSPIGYYNHVTSSDSLGFSGSFDGNGYTVSNLYIVTPTDTPYSYGLFGFASEALIENLTLTNIQVVGTGTVEEVGLLVGRSLNSSFRHVTLSGRLSKSNGPGCAVHCGGLAGIFLANGSATSIILQNLSVDAQMQAVNTVGGLIGRVTVDGDASLSVENVSVSGSLQGQPGLVGTGGAGTLGGFIGYLGSEGTGLVTLSNVTTDFDWECLDQPGFTTVASSFSGLFIGTLNVDMGSTFRLQRCSANGTAKTVDTTAYGGTYVGGLWGLASVLAPASSVLVEECYALGQIQIRTPSGNRSVVGGMFGELRLSANDVGYVIRNSFSRVNILFSSTGTLAQSSSLIGRTQYLSGSTGTIELDKLYSSGSISAPVGTLAASVAGVMGTNGGGAVSATSLFFNQAHFSSAVGTGTAIAGTSGLATSAFSIQSNFTGWDFSTVWRQNTTTGFPELRRVD